MDALFEPIADATGATVDQIKVCLLVNKVDVVLMLLMLAHILLTVLLPSRQSLHPHTHIPS